MAMLDMSDKEVEASISLLHMMQPAKGRVDDAQGHASTLEASDALHDSLLQVVASQTAARESEPSKPAARRNLQLNTLSRELTLDELRGHFGKPIVEVAREFGICTTFLKKICRRCGIKRWPHRQIRSLARTIQMLRQVEALATTSQEKAKYATQIRQLEAKQRAVFENPDANGKLKRVKKYSAAKSNRRGGGASVAANFSAGQAAVSSDSSTNNEGLGPCSPLVVAANSFLSVPKMEMAADTTVIKQEPQSPSLAGIPGSPPALGVLIPPPPPFSDMSGPMATPMHAGAVSTERISPCNRKLAVLIKAEAESRLRSSSIGSLQGEREQRDAVMGAGAEA